MDAYRLDMESLKGSPIMMVNDPEPIYLECDCSDDFVYGVTSISIQVTRSNHSSDVDLTITREGMIQLRMTDGSQMDVDDSEFLLGRIYERVMDSLYPDAGTGSGKSNPGGVSIFHAKSSFAYGDDDGIIIMDIFNSMSKDIRDSMEFLYGLMIKPRPSNLNHLGIHETMIHDSYATAFCTISYAMNYVNLFYGDDPTYSNSLRIHRETLDSIYASHCNTDSHVLNNSFVRTIELMEIQNQESSDISRQMRLIAIAALLTPYLTSLVTLLPVLLRRWDD